MQLYSIRHAQSENNPIWAEMHSENGRVPDPSLTDVGHQQAELLATHLAENKGEAETEQIHYNRHFT